VPASAGVALAFTDTLQHVVAARACPPGDRPGGTNLWHIISRLGVASVTCHITPPNGVMKDIVSGHVDQLVRSRCHGLKY
jgi:hypothetical protein